MGDILREKFERRLAVFGQFVGDLKFAGEQARTSQGNEKVMAGVPDFLLNGRR